LKAHLTHWRQNMEHNLARARACRCAVWFQPNVILQAAPTSARQDANGRRADATFWTMSGWIPSTSGVCARVVAEITARRQWRSQTNFLG